MAAITPCPSLLGTIPSAVPQPKAQMGAVAWQPQPASVPAGPLESLQQGTWTKT